MAAISRPPPPDIEHDDSIILSRSWAQYWTQLGWPYAMRIDEIIDIDQSETSPEKDDG